MPSQRRGRFLLIAVVAALFLFFYYSGEGSKIQNQKFYQSTLRAMNTHEAAKQAAAAQEKVSNAMHRPDSNIAAGGAAIDDVERPAVPVAKDKEKDEVEEIPIAGRTKMQISKNREETSDSEEQKAKDELNSILKQSPIIIFSKSYCPHSMKAKSILLGKYSIVPKPSVTELDQHPIGKGLQELLGQSTGRHTVPNILVNGKSIGGGDEIAALDQSDELASTLRQLGGKWVVEVTRQEPAGAQL